MRNLADFISDPISNNPLAKFMFDFMYRTKQPIEFLVDDILYDESPPK